MAQKPSGKAAMRLEDLVVPAKNGEHRSIPGAKFIEKVETFVGSCNPASVEYLFKELLQKYRFMEHSLLGQKDTLRAKTVAIKETMSALEMLKKHRDIAKEGGDGDIQTHFQLAETIHVQADILVEYSIQEAEDVLNKSLQVANKNLEEAEADMEWLRTQITMTEVNIARVHNYAVLKMQQRQAAAGAGKLPQPQPESP